MLVVEHVRKTYRRGGESFIALDDVSLSVGSDECVGVIGASGSGKSTLASVVIGLEAADGGTEVFNGVPLDVSVRPAARPKAQRAALLDMQMVFQHPASSFMPRMKVADGIREGLAYRPGYCRDEAAAKVTEALECVGLPARYGSKRIGELSGGECQRAAIARAIISRPKLLVCDEPTSALDVTVQASVIELLVRLRRELAMSCLFISHDLALVRGFCDRVYVMDAGRVVEEGPSAILFENPRTDVARRLVAAAVTR